ncbi:mite allergen Eur m 3-like [Ischnura elegans]|uniref:mite allergen Eur m 3-like n=1 Tax=Ischnura elegans TaxID=197161 RepID=UPI001ED88F57|nr:mite allergen Eur m 3-like [Ischnura elegans]
MGKLVCVIFILSVGATLGFSIRRPGGVVGNDLLRKFHPYPFITGGEKVEGREFPGQISLQSVSSGFVYHLCGASIVNANYILTAAHCSQDAPDQYSVLAGTNSLVKGGTRHNVTAIHYHEQYDPEHSWHNDLAVMKVDPPFVFDAEGATAPVTLADQEEDTPVGSKATVIGWGVNADNGIMPDDLYKVDIQIWDQELCKEAYKPLEYEVYPEHICANTEDGGKGSCSGDSGGPLFVNGKVVGLVSWAKGCDEKGFPTVFTRVSSYRDWIDSNVSA